jgi:nicotinate-nucleotide--dimethylbenzimidazole phosphoribosyltransferase
MSDLDTELRALGEGIVRPRANEQAAQAGAEAIRRHGRLGVLARWWASVHPQGPLRHAAITWQPNAGALGGGTALTPATPAFPSRADGSTAAALQAGRTAADELADQGVDLLVVHLAVTADVDPAARRLVCAMLGLDAAEALGWPAPVGGRLEPDDATWTAQAARLRDDLRALRPATGGPADVLERLGDPVLIAGTSLLLQAAARRTPLMLTGFAALACAAVARRIAPAAFTWWQIASTLADPLHGRLVASSNLTPVLALDSGTESLTGGRLALAVLGSASHLAFSEPASAQDSPAGAPTSAPESGGDGV